MTIGIRPQQRIRKEDSFRAVIKSGCFVRGKLLHLWCLSQKKLPSCQSIDKPMLGIIVSKKTSRLATKRNLWKRRIREAFRNNQQKLKPGVAVIIQSRQAKEMPSYQEVSDELWGLLKKANTLKK